MGPISSMVIQESFSGRYEHALNLAIGGSIAEGIYAIGAYIAILKLVGNSKVLDYIIPVLKFVAAIIVMNIGRSFTQMTVHTFDVAGENQTSISVRDGVMKGFNISIVNPALIANHIALITAILPYHLIEYKKRYLPIWGFGATAGMISWFYLLITLLRTYRKSLKITTIVWILNNLGSVLIMIGIYSLFTILWKLV